MYGEGSDILSTLPPVHFKMELPLHVWSNTYGITGYTHLVDFPGVGRKERRLLADFVTETGVPGAVATLLSLEHTSIEM